MNYKQAKAKADALLRAGDALAEQFPAESKRLLRLCRKWRERQHSIAREQNKDRT